MKLVNGFAKASSINISTNTTISPPSKAIVVGGAGVVNVTMADGGTILLLPFAVGVPQHVAVTAISNVNSTATGVVVYK